MLLVFFTLEKCWEMCSFSENVARRLTQTFPEEFVNYNKAFLSRVYPAGKRLDSSNYNPQEMWNCGCQLGELYKKCLYAIVVVSFHPSRERQWNMRHSFSLLWGCSACLS